MPLENQPLSSLKPYNTFGVDVQASDICFISKIEDIEKRLPIEDVLIIGGGSNILLTQNIDIPVWINQLVGIRSLEEDDDFIELGVASGENWHQFVLWTIENDYGGIENLSLIPGSVGAAPMQNIGAYGVEVKNLITYVKFFNLKTGQQFRLDNDTCEFGYRDSIFKKDLKNEIFITDVGFRLTKRNHTINADYGDIKRLLNEKGIYSPTIKEISDTVITIRQSKLPDPSEIGNAGSFFKNPIIEKVHFLNLKEKHPNIVGYPVGDNEIKVAAGWLIDNAGWKGYRQDNYGVHTKQALVLVNYSDAKGQEIFQLSEKIIHDIYDKFGIQLEREVNIF